MDQYGWGTPAPRAPTPPPVVAYGSFADRLGGLYLDSLVYSLAQIPIVIGYFIMTWVVGMAIGSSDVCRYDPDSSRSYQSQYEACLDSGTWWFLGVLVLFVIALLWAWWRIIPGRMVRRGASVGMSIAGLKIEEEDTSDRIGSFRSLARALLAGILPLAFGLIPVVILIVMLGTDPEIGDFLGIGIVVLLVVAVLGYALPWLWAIWDPRNQTLYDKFAGTVVTGPAGPMEPWAVASLVCGVLAIFGLFPLGPLAVIFGNLAIKGMAGTRGQFKGRGAARAGQVLGCIATLYLLVAIVAGVLLFREGRHADTCRTDAAQLETAAATFVEQTGRYPENDTELVFVGLLDEESERYNVRSDPNGIYLVREDRSCPVIERE